MRMNAIIATEQSVCKVHKRCSVSERAWSRYSFTKYRVSSTKYRKSSPHVGSGSCIILSPLFICGGKTTKLLMFKLTDQIPESLNFNFSSAPYLFVVFSLLVSLVNRICIEESAFYFHSCRLLCSVCRAISPRSTWRRCYSSEVRRIEQRGSANPQAGL